MKEGRIQKSIQLSFVQQQLFITWTSRSFHMTCRFLRIGLCTFQNNSKEQTCVRRIRKPDANRRLEEDHVHQRRPRRGVVQQLGVVGFVDVERALLVQVAVQRAAACTGTIAVTQRQCTDTTFPHTKPPRSHFTRREYQPTRLHLDTQQVAVGCRRGVQQGSRRRQRWHTTAWPDLDRRSATAQRARSSGSTLPPQTSSATSSACPAAA